MRREMLLQYPGFTLTTQKKKREKKRKIRGRRKKSKWSGPCTLAIIHIYIHALCNANQRKIKSTILICLLLASKHRFNIFLDKLIQYDRSSRLIDGAIRLRFMHDRFPFAVDHSSRSVNETDRVSLLELKAEIEEDPLGLLSSWNESAHFCLWPGVTCSRRHSQRVTRLDLRSWKLKGKLSPHVGNLSFLRTLNLANNSLSQAIPPEIGRLFRLRVLNMRNNSFGGEIPANVSGCYSLQFLYMLNNNLTGRIPKEIGLLSKLRSLELSGNSLVGEIPASIGNLSLLSDFRLMGNKLQGTIPHSLSWLKSLEALVLAYNNLRGNVKIL